MKLFCLGLAGIVAVALGACGDNIHHHEDADAAVDAFFNYCGNGMLDPGEDCDDGDTLRDVVCTETCHFTCGDGTVDDALGELCDTGIAAGATGACPASCNDNMACTSDVLAGSECTAACMHSAITTPVNGDGCCPAGANSLTDNDCSVTCGNGVVEAGETCDTAITTGAGSCPASCNDGMSCTTDTLMSGGTCQAACGHTNITLPMNNDGCCPPGANTGNDNDCQPGCGNGVVDAGETCDTAITNGAGRCPTTCSDGMSCTRDVLANGGTCTAACTFPAITTCTASDGCCPTGCNANNDNNCTPVCGNGVVEGTEACDDGNTNNTDACSNTCTVNTIVTAFRFSDLDVRDPHVFVNFIGCRDVTDTQLAGFSVNNELNKSITTDGTDADTFLDLSPTIVFRNFNQTAATQPTQIYFANCTSPVAGTTCHPGTQAPIAATATFMSGGQCLAALTGTTHPYAPAVTATSGPCFVTNAVTVTLSLGGIPITLRDARIAATYVGNPATSTVNGLLMGFISEADANATTIPASFPLVGGMPLSSLLAGGTNACPSYSDKDTNNGVVGWWFYLNFPTTKVTWAEP